MRTQYRMKVSPVSNILNWNAVVVREYPVKILHFSSFINFFHLIPLKNTKNQCNHERTQMNKSIKELTNIEKLKSDVRYASLVCKF